jgi:pyridoxine kinase
MPLADIATPNRFELEWLYGRTADDLAALVALAAEARPARMLVTSAYPMLAGGTGNLLVTPTQALLAEHRLVERPPNGVGDLTAALFLARQLRGETDEKALLSTTAAVYEVLARAVKRGGDELQLEADAASLSRPMALVRTRRLGRPARDRRS